MIVRNITDINRSERNVAWGNGQSRRFLLASDGMGFSLTDTIVDEGTTSHLEYKNHLECCYCIEGVGEIKSTHNEQVHPIKVGTMYALDQNDSHFLTAHTRMRLVCVFSPALLGQEMHDLNGHSSSCY